jgi:hypothetical protein
MGFAHTSSSMERGAVAPEDPGDCMLPAGAPAAPARGLRATAGCGRFELGSSSAVTATATALVAMVLLAATLLLLGGGVGLGWRGNGQLRLGETAQPQLATPPHALAQPQLAAAPPALKGNSRRPVDGSSKAAAWQQQVGPVFGLGS